jgi:hypothetical protein
MEDAERFRFLGTYRTPRFRYGRKVLCEVRGEPVITCLSDAPIPSPIGRRGCERPSLVVYKGLARAIRRESEQAVCRWWGLCPTTVWKCRKDLGVGIATEGTSRLHREVVERTSEAMRPRGQEGPRPPAPGEDRRSTSGKPKSPHVLEAMHGAWRDSRPTKESLRRMSETHRRRGTLVPGTIPWTQEEDELLKTLSAEVAAKRTGRSLSAVYARCRRLGLPDGRRQRGEERPRC